MTEIIYGIFEKFGKNGGALYDGGEAVTQLEHALQTAWFLEQEGADDALVAAALLHDYGHVMGKSSSDVSDREVDAKHEETGARFLSRHFIPAVTEPGRLHVAAKRYLCTTDPDYFGQLSPVSVRSLELQGGPFSDEEVKVFEANPFCRDAVHLRKCDEKGKVPDLETPNLEYYRRFLEAGLKENA